MTVRKIVMPAAVPAWLVGARLASVIALLVSIVVEMVMYQRGLGGGLVASLNALAPARMWAYALVCGAIGFALYALLGRVVRFAAAWQPSQSWTYRSQSRVKSRSLRRRRAGYSPWSPF